MRTDQLRNAGSISASDTSLTSRQVLLKTDEAAQRLNVCRKIIYNLNKAGKLNKVKLFGATPRRWSSTIANALDHEMRFVFVSRCSFFQTGLRKSSDCVSDSEPSELKLDRAFRRFPWEGKAATSFSVAK